MQVDTEVEFSPDIPKVVADPDGEGIGDVDLVMYHETMDMDEVEYIRVDAFLDESQWPGPKPTRAHGVRT